MRQERVLPRCGFGLLDFLICIRLPGILEETVSFANSTRLQNKNKWYFIHLTGTDKEGNNIALKIKGFNTWLQVFQIGTIDNSNCMDQSIKHYKKHIEKVLNDRKISGLEIN